MLTLKQIRKLYQDYAFMDEAPASGRCSEAKTGDYNLWSPLNRSYEGQSWYFIVFAPFNKAYTKDKDWFQVKGVDAARKWAYPKCSDFYITRELESTNVPKTHINLLCVSHTDLFSKYHGKSCYNKYRMNVQLLSRPQDRLRVFSYINKERASRDFQKYLDTYNT